MGRWGALIALIATGCINPDLVACGDLACPAGSVCVDGTRCVDPVQLAACTDLAPGDECSVNGVAGRCSAGACVVITCGNGQLEPGELCDDGNLTSGDGCNGTCSSLEVCGNGVIDVAMGEGCDCGTTENKSALCASANSDDPMAECTPMCEPRFCGDGAVNTIEQCDGTVLSGHTCAEFGFYRGDLTCSGVCQLDPKECSGKCGDGVVDVANGEYCDGTVPASDTCLRFGFDLGTLACGTACGPQLSACHLLGWERLHDVIDAVNAVASGGGAIGVVYANGDAYAIEDGVSLKAPHAYNNVAGRATELFALGDGLVSRWTHATGWVDLAPPPWTGTAYAAQATDFGLFVVTGTGPLYRFDGTTWTQVAGPWNVDYVPNLGPTHSFVTVSAYAVWTWNGTTWSAFTDLTGVTNIAERGDGVVFVSTYGGVYRREANSSYTKLTTSPANLYPTTDGVFANSGSYPIVELGTIPLVTTLPGIGVLGALDGIPLIGLADGLYGLARGVWWDVQPTTSGTLQPVLDGGPLVRTRNGLVEVLASSGSWTVLTTPATCARAGVASNGTLYCATGTDVWDGNTAHAIDSPVGGASSTPSAGPRPSSRRCRRSSMRSWLRRRPR